MNRLWILDFGFWIARCRGRCRRVESALDAKVGCGRYLSLAAAFRVANQNPKSKIHNCRLVSLLVGVAALMGCAGPSGPIFPAVVPSIVWPKPPDAPRIRYVGQLKGESSLGRKPAGLAALRAVLGGPPPVIDFATPMAVAVDGAT